MLSPCKQEVHSEDENFTSLHATLKYCFAVIIVSRILKMYHGKYHQVKEDLSKLLSYVKVTLNILCFNGFILLKFEDTMHRILPLFSTQ